MSKVYQWLKNIILQSAWKTTLIVTIAYQYHIHSLSLNFPGEQNATLVWLQFPLGSENKAMSVEIVLLLFISHAILRSQIIVWKLHYQIWTCKYWYIVFWIYMKTLSLSFKMCMKWIYICKIFFSGYCMMSTDIKWEQLVDRHCNRNHVNVLQYFKTIVYL